MRHSRAGRTRRHRRHKRTVHYGWRAGQLGDPSKASLAPPRFVGRICSSDNLRKLRLQAPFKDGGPADLGATFNVLQGPHSCAVVVTARRANRRNDKIARRPLAAVSMSGMTLHAPRSGKTLAALTAH